MTIEKTLDLHKGKIFYRVTGAGPAVVLLHGIPANGDLWQSQFRVLTKFRFIVPDLPGSGASGMIGDMSMEGMAEAVKTILDSEKISSVTMIGHSMGGYIALAFAENYPHYLNGLGLFHSTAYADSKEKKATRKKGIEFVENNGAYEFFKTSVPALFSSDSKEKVAHKIEDLIAATNNFSTRVFVSYYEAMMERPDRTNVLKNIKKPVLFIAGKHDIVVPIHDSLELCHLPEISYFHALAKSGHMGMIEDAEESNAILNDYLINLS